MFYYDLFEKAGHYHSIQSMFDDLSNDSLFISEIKEILTILQTRCNAPEKKDNSAYSDWNPLRLHGVYTKAQIEAALGISTFERESTSSRDGVERVRDIKLEAMYVDIIKKREEGSLTNYQDYARNREFFQWETQHKVSADCPTAQQYRNRENHQLLFVRQQSTHPEYKHTLGYTYLGEVVMHEMEGSKPIKILWHLNTPMSEATYAFASQYKAIG